MAGSDVFSNPDGGKIANEATKRVVHFRRKSDGVYALGILMVPSRGAGSPAQSALTGEAGEWKH
eukprot:11635969-Alexandrium_andersonii.AAC.1